MKALLLGVVGLFCLLAVGSAALAPPAFSQGQDRVLVKGEPALTEGMVDRVTDFFEWSLGVRLSAEQKAEVRGALVDSWRKNDRAEIDSTEQLLGLHAQLSALSDERLAAVRGEVREEVLKGLRQDPNDKIALMLLSLYEARGRAGSGGAAGAGTAGPPSPVKVGAGDLYGIYIATTRQLIAPGPDSPVQKGILWLPGREWITFLPGGRVFLGLPEEGLAGFDFDAAVRKYPESKGAYQVRGDVVHVVWAAGGEKVLRRAADGDLWEDRTNYTPLPKCTGLRLSGRYGNPDDPSSRAYISFSPEGRFEERELLQYISWKSLAGPAERAVAEVRQGGGTYAIGDNTILLRYADGREARINFYTFAEELRKPRPEVIYINSFDFRPKQ